MYIQKPQARETWHMRCMHSHRDADSDASYKRPIRVAGRAAFNIPTPAPTLEDCSENAGTAKWVQKISNYYGKFPYTLDSTDYFGCAALGTGHCLPSSDRRVWLQQRLDPEESLPLRGRPDRGPASIPTSQPSIKH